MKKIVLHRATVDNTGAFVDAGAELTIGDKGEAGVITADRARDLVDSGGALSATAAAAAEAKAAEPAKGEAK